MLVYFVLVVVFAFKGLKNYCCDVSVRNVSDALQCIW